MELVGRLTADASVRTVKGDKKVVGFSIAINSGYKTKDGERKKVTTYFDCSFWRNASVAPYLKKGTLVQLSGQAAANAWTNKDGVAKASLTFHVNDLTLHGRSNSNSSERVETEAVVATNTYPDTKDDLPF